VRRPEIAIQQRHQRRLAGAIRAAHLPVLTARERPVEGADDRSAIAIDRGALQPQQRLAWQGIASRSRNGPRAWRREGRCSLQFLRGTTVAGPACSMAPWTMYA